MTNNHTNSQKVTKQITKTNHEQIMKIKNTRSEKSQKQVRTNSEKQI